MKSSVRSPAGILSVEREVIPVSYLSAPDENWQFTDAAGHEHYWTGDQALMTGGSHYPTLTEVADRVYWCGGCRDDHADSHLACRLCGETVQPGMTGPGTVIPPGLTSYYLDGVPVTPERAQEIITAMQQRAKDRADGAAMDALGVPQALRGQWDELQG